MAMAINRRMNHREAVLHARASWGSAGEVELRRAADPNERCVVGTKGAAAAHQAYGCGATWEAAFYAAGRPVRRAKRAAVAR